MKYFSSIHIIYKNSIVVLKKIYVAKFDYQKNTIIKMSCDMCLLQPCPLSNFKKIALAPHDFAENFYLI